MEKTTVQKLAKILKVLITVTFVCNVLVLFLVPRLVSCRFHHIVLGYVDTEMLRSILALDTGSGLAMLFEDFFYSFFLAVWQQPYTAVLTIFLWVCGICTAVILWQARRVLDTILEGNPFQNRNGENMKRAAVCFFLISTAALLRVVWGLFYYGTIQPLLSYTALFVPVFALGGLLCMVMSALFRQAAELKAENDLTI